jgi:hypothetical protein
VKDALGNELKAGDLLEGLQELAKDENISVSHLVRRWIVKAMCFEEDEEDNVGNRIFERRLVKATYK